MSVLDTRITELSGLVTDIRLPGGSDGWEIARHARELRSDLPIVYTTADSAADWPVKGVPNSVVVQKPYAGAQLLTAISTLVTAAEAASPAVSFACSLPPTIAFMLALSASLAEAAALPASAAAFALWFTASAESPLLWPQAATERAATALVVIMKTRILFPFRFPVWYPADGVHVRARSTSTTRTGSWLLNGGMSGFHPLRTLGACPFSTRRR